MSDARDRIGRMQPDNLPNARPGRRRPPDDDPTPQPAAPPAEPGHDLSVVPDMSDPASKLASMLARPDETDTPGGAPAGGRGDGPSVPLSALTTPPPVDPELDLVNLGVRAPRYLASAIRTQAFLERRTQQDVVLGALRGERPLARELLDECRRSATTRTPRT